ncbi:UDP-glucuronic acid decarboxylase family protein [Lysobacter sp. D1-1-M9]|uniref:UDP-glucuronic acid decarboxylase family protein n=1 Tax=Novilysobacter longmucuonensis TaxID=3098603 RepID=UPI002FC71DC2
MDGSNGKRNGAGKRALVTGGAGFLGSHLCARLLEDGYEVVAMDNLATGSMRNLRPLLGRGLIQFIEQDVVNPDEAQLAGFRADRIFNLACCASPLHYQADPEKTIRTCIDGSLNMLHLARQSGARIFLSSTSEVYGEPEVHPQMESYRGSVSSIGPRACYDEGKRCAEAAFFDYHRVHGTEIKVARIFNTYGPSMQADDGRVVSNLIVQALRNEPMTINGDGSQTRSFCYVDDLIEGIVRLMDSPAEVTGPVNLGNPSEVTVLQLSTRIIELTGSRSKLRHRPMPVDDPTRRCPDITLARQSLGWAPQVSLDEGLRRTIAWFEETLANGHLDLGTDSLLQMEINSGCN